MKLSKKEKEGKKSLHFVIDNNVGSFEWYSQTDDLLKRFEKQRMESYETMFKSIDNDDLECVPTQIEKLTSYIEENTDFLPAYLEMGSLLYSYGDYRSALFCLSDGLRVATSIIPDKFKGYIKRMGLFNESFFEICVLLVKTHLKLGEYKTALQIGLFAYNCAEELDDIIIECYVVALIYNGMLKEALKVFDEFEEELELFYPPLSFWYPWLLFHAGDIDRARKYFQRNFKNHPDFGEVLLAPYHLPVPKKKKKHDDLFLYEFLPMKFVKDHFPLWVNDQLQQMLRDVRKISKIVRK